MEWKTMTIDDIIDWCQANNQVAWLKATAAQKTTQKRYPRVKGEDGKYTVDKTQEPKVVETPITFIELKTKFVETFMPELLPQKQEKKPTMFDRINAL